MNLAIIMIGMVDGWEFFNGLYDSPTNEMSEGGLWFIPFNQMPVDDGSVFYHHFHRKHSQ